MARLRSPDLPGVQGLVDAAAAQRAALDADLAAVLIERDRTWQVLCRRERLPLRLIPGPWRMRARRAFAASESEALSIRAAIHRTRIRVAFEASSATLAAQAAAWEAFAALCRAERSWEVLGSTAVDGERERSAASINVERVPMVLALGRDDLLAGDRPALRLGTAAGARLDLHPGFAALRERETGPHRLLDPRDVAIEVGAVDFLEEAAVPADARVVGHAWTRANRDGSPDRRFKNNRQIPWLRYGTMRITTPLGVFAELQISDCEGALAFGAAFRQMQAAMAGMAREPPSDEPVRPIAPAPQESLPPLRPLANAGRSHPTAAAAVAAALVLALGLLAAVASRRPHVTPLAASVDPGPVAAGPPAAPPAPPPPPITENPAAPLVTGSLRRPTVRRDVVRQGGLGTRAASLGRRARPPEASADPGPAVAGWLRPPVAAPPRIETPAAGLATRSDRTSLVRPDGVPAPSTMGDFGGSRTTTRRPTTLRDCPTRTSPGLAMLARGTPLDVFGRHGAWVEVGQSRPWGWISVKSLAHAT